MAVMRFGVRTGAVLMRGMYMGILAKEICICVQKESVSKSLPKTKQEREGLPEAGGVLQSRHARG